MCANTNQAERGGCFVSLSASSENEFCALNLMCRCTIPSIHPPIHPSIHKRTLDVIRICSAPRQQKKQTATHMCTKSSQTLHHTTPPHTRPYAHTRVSQLSQKPRDALAPTGLPYKQVRAYREGLSLTSTHPHEHAVTELQASPEEAGMAC